MDISTSQYMLADQHSMSRAKNYFAWQGRLVTPELGQRVLEVGCGMGNFTEMLTDREAVLGIDSDPACINEWLIRYEGYENLSALVCDIEKPDFLALKKFRPDSCVCLNVLEHVQHDLDALRSMTSILEPQGVIVLLVPAFPALTGPIDERLGHFRRYTRRSLMEIAAVAGLEIEQLRYLNSIGFFGWWINSHIFRRKQQSVLQIEIFDRAVVPWLSRLEARTAPPFGQSLFAVLRKR